MISGKSIITIRQQKSNKIFKVGIGDFFKMVSSDNYVMNKTNKRVMNKTNKRVMNKTNKRVMNKTNNYEIMSPYGWIKIHHIKKFNNKKKKFIIKTASYQLGCCINNEFLKNNIDKVNLINLKVGDMITTEKGLEPIIDITNTGCGEDMFDIKCKTPQGSIFVCGLLVS